MGALGTPKPVFTPMRVYGVALYLVKPPSWGKVSGGHPSPSSSSQGICRVAGQKLCVSIGRRFNRSLVRTGVRRGF